MKKSLFLTGILGALLAPAYADVTISANTTPTEDYTDTGKLTVTATSGTVSLNLNTFKANSFGSVDLTSQGSGVSKIYINQGGSDKKDQTLTFANVKAQGNMATIYANDLSGGLSADGTGTCQTIQLTGTTNIESGTLELANSWSGKMIVDKLTGSGALNIKTDNEVGSYTISEMTGYTGNINIAKSNLYVFIGDADKSTTIGGSLTNKGHLTIGNATFTGGEQKSIATDTTITVNSSLTFSGATTMNLTAAGTTSGQYNEPLDSSGLKGQSTTWTVFDGAGTVNGTENLTFQLNGVADHGEYSEGTYTSISYDYFVVNETKSLSEVNEAAGSTVFHDIVLDGGTLTGITTDTPGHTIKGTGTIQLGAVGSTLNYNGKNFADSFAGKIVLVGTVNVENEGSHFGAASGIEIQEDGALSVNRNATISKAVTLNGGALINAWQGITVTTVNLTANSTIEGLDNRNTITTMNATAGTLQTKVMHNGTWGDCRGAVSIGTLNVSGDTGLDTVSKDGGGITISDMKADSGTITLNARSADATYGQISITKLDMNGSNNKTGSVVIASGNTTITTSLWMGKSDRTNVGTMTIKDGASLTLSGGKLVIKGKTGTDASLKRTGNTSAYGINETSYTISDAAVELTGGEDAASATTVGVQLSDSSVTNLSGYTTVTKGSINGVTVSGGHLAVTDATENTNLGAITLSGGTLSLGSFDDHSGKGLTTSSLTVSGTDSTLNANLVMSGGTLTFADGSVLTMGCDVKIGTLDTVTVVLTDAMVQSIAEGGHVVLFDSVESATLGEHITFSGNLQAPTDVYALVYDKTAKTIYVTPEPATATLSLLALAALAARRKRH